MNAVPDVLLDAIRTYMEGHPVPPAFFQCLERLEAQGFSLVHDPGASLHEVRWHAADFVIHYIELALDDHHLSECEIQNIASLKRIYRLEEGDLLEIQRQRIADLLRLEMARILADEHVDDPEVMHQSDLQRALGLGYDQYLQLTRESIRPVVDRILDDARGGSERQRSDIIRKLQALQTVVRIDRETMTAIWPD